jgi:CDP-glycerol glycerophosphotransferase
MTKYAKAIRLVRILISYFLARCIVAFVPLRKNKFFCISMTGNSYGDSIKCLSDYIAVHNPSSTIVWAFTDIFYNLTDCEHKKVKLYTFRYYFHILTSKYILSNVSLDKKMLLKRKGQICVQTWHGTALKRIGIDMYSHKELSHHGIFTGGLITEYNAKLTDILVSVSRFMTKILHEKCLYPMQVIHELGTPRNDIFFQQKPEVIEKVRAYYGIAKDTKIILYAPTFRAGGDFTYYDVDLQKIKTMLEQKYGEKYVNMVRLHPNLLKNKEDFLTRFPSDTIDASSYPDMIELLYSADVLVTDYSSCMFDFMYSYKPVILYVPDRLTYDRGFYLDIDKLPFIVINNNAEIDSRLLGYNPDEYKEKLSNFLLEIGSVEEGTATASLYELFMSI